MINTEYFIFNGFQTRCTVLWDENGNCAIADPGAESQAERNSLITFISSKGLKPVCIMLTHAHFDHVGAVRQIAADSDCEVFVEETELSLPPTMTDGPIYYTDLYPAEGVVSVADMDFKVLRTPGHTPGSVCLLVEDAMFSGDTLFAGSMGRCDFPGSNIFDMRKSLKKLYDLAGDYRVFPGHAQATTLDYERKTNPYLR